MKKIVLILIALSGYTIGVSWASKHVLNDGQRIPDDIARIIIWIADLPHNARAVIEMVVQFHAPTSVANPYSKYNPRPAGKSGLKGQILVPYISSNGLNRVSIIRMGDSRELVIYETRKSAAKPKYSDSLTQSTCFKLPEFSTKGRVEHPYLFADGSLVYNIYYNDLICVNIGSGEEKWRIEGAFHHSISIDYLTNIWACASAKIQQANNATGSWKLFYRKIEDQILVNVTGDGRVINQISIAELLVNSGLEYLLFGLNVNNSNTDPFHLNEISPVLADSKILKKGDLIVSLRNLSTILGVDPVTKRVKWHKSGPWMKQHSVMKLTNDLVSVLDNHSFGYGSYWLDKSWRTRVLTLDLESSVVQEVTLSNESPIRFRIPVEGRVFKTDDNVWILEDCMNGTILAFKDESLIFKWSNLYQDGKVGITSWCRYLPEEKISIDKISTMKYLSK